MNPPPLTPASSCFLVGLRVALWALSTAAFSGCGEQLDAAVSATGEVLHEATDYNDLNLAAGTLVLYEVQARSANACHPDVGDAGQRLACQTKIAPTIPYRAQGMTCNVINDLHKIRMGTLDDLLEDSANYRRGITVRYVNERVGANTLWLMPMFPNNDTWNLPDACDNLGSPYAVRDYFHISGTLSRSCIQAGRDEYASTPCWGGGSLDAVIAQAHARGMKVMLDVAFNHLGHNYLMYDGADHTPVRERIAAGEDLGRLWDFAGTFEANLLHPDVLDTPAKLATLAGASSFHRQNLAALSARCPGLSGDALLRSYNMWRDALDGERAKFPCDPAAAYLELADPGFYLGKDSFNPSQRLGDNFTNNWADVKFLFHHGDNVAHQWEFIRQREYLFRVLNHWTSRGVDGFRLDHTTDPNSGMNPDEWKYLTSKVDYYAFRRGQARPVFLAEEFGDQLGMNKVVDSMTEGYVGDMNGRGGTTKDTGHVEGVVSNMDRFGGHAFVMAALETHDERRLVDGTGFDIFTGAGFFGIGATTRSTPMLLMGQEFGEPWQLGFRRSDFLRGRFVGSGNYNPAGDALSAFYKTLIGKRLDAGATALVAANYAFLRRQDGGGVDGRIFAQAKWAQDGNVVLVFHNLWVNDVAQTYFISPELGNAMLIRDGTSYKLVDLISGTQMGPCRNGADLKWGLYVSMSAATRAQWLRLETCG